MMSYNDIEDFAAGEICRVGGMALTRRAVEFCAFTPKARLADIGCGKGATVRYLRSEGFDACGLDCYHATDSQSHCQNGDALNMPYETGSMEGLFFECSLSQMDNSKRILREAQRVLRPGGKLIVSDLFARAQNDEFNNPLMSRARWLELLSMTGFSCLLFEDKSEDLKALNAQMIWLHGREILKELYYHGCDAFALKAARCGYFLMIGEQL